MGKHETGTKAVVLRVIAGRYEPRLENYRIPEPSLTAADVACLVDPGTAESGGREWRQLYARTYRALRSLVVTGLLECSLGLVGGRETRLYAPVSHAVDKAGRVDEIKIQMEVKVATPRHLLNANGPDERKIEAMIAQGLRFTLKGIGVEAKITRAVAIFPVGRFVHRVNIADGGLKGEA